METASKAISLKEEAFQLVDYILENGYEIKIVEKRSNSPALSTGKVYFDREELLKENLLNICVYKTDELTKTVQYLNQKVKDIKALLELTSDVKLDSENIEVIEYISNKPKEKC